MMRNSLAIAFLVLCAINVSAQTQTSSREEVFNRVSEGLKGLATGTVTHQTGPLVKDKVEYARFDACRFTYRRTSAVLSPTLLPVRGGKAATTPVGRAGEFEIEEWRFALSDIDPRSVAVVKPWAAGVGQRLYIEFAAESGKKLIERKEQREPWRRERGKVAKGRLTIHDDAAAGERVAADLRRAIELCRQ